VYGEVIAKLVKQGIPRAEIADIGSADTDVKKQALFAKVRSGAIRVLLGSTQKMGTGNGWSPCTIWMRRGNRLRWSSGKAGFCARGIRMRKCRFIAM
jgi:hypothetical protein